MASINWGSGVIFVPKTDLDLVQSVPTEIYNLDLNFFRLNLKDLEDDQEGMSFLDTHAHNGQVLLGGITYARIIDILDPYTITFEDGQYAVNLVGANSNVADKTNVNQVSVRPQNSAGLITTQAIEFGEYGDAITLDVVNGVVGQIYPIGTRRKPSNNIYDTTLIANFYGFSSIRCLDHTTFGTTNGVPDDIIGMQIYGVTHVNTKITVEDSCLCLKTAFYDCEISGILDGDSEIRNCVVNGLTYFNGHIHNSFLIGEIILAGSLKANIEKCSILDFDNPPIINAGGSGQDLMMPNYSGILIISNLTGNSKIGIGLDAGQIIIEDTCTAGTIQISGNGSVIDNSGPDCYVVDSIVNGTDIQNIQRLIETQRPHHTGTGNIWFWSPDLGNDLINDGKHPDRAFKTWATVEAHIIDNNHDIIMLVPDSSTGNTVITEKVIITKNYVFIRGPGRDIHFQVDDIECAFDIQSNGVELAGFRITNTLGLGVRSTGSFPLLNNIWLENCANGAYFSGAYPIVQNTKIHGASGYALKFEGDIDHGEITNVKTGGAGSNAIEVDTSVGYGGIYMKDTVITKATGYGVNLSATTTKFIISNDCVIINNTLGDVNDLGSGNVDGSELSREIPHLKLLEHRIYIDSELLTGGDGSQHSPFGSITDAIDEAERLNIHNLIISSSIDLDRDIKNFTITGIGTPTVDTGGFNIEGCEFYHCKMRGDYLGNIIAHKCNLAFAFTLNGGFNDCRLGSTFTIPDGGSATIKDSSSFSSTGSPPSFDVGGAGSASLDIVGHNGGVNILNCNQPTDIVKVLINVGRIVVDVSCTDGTMNLGGIAVVSNNGSVTNYFDNTIKPSDIKDIHLAETGRRKSDGSEDTIYEEDLITPRKVFNITKNGSGEVIEINPI